MSDNNMINQISSLDISKKTVLNILYTQNCISDQFYEILKPFDISAEQFNVLRILRGQKGSPANMCLIQERMLAKTSNTTRLVDKLLLKDLAPNANLRLFGIGSEAIRSGAEKLLSGLVQMNWNLRLVACGWLLWKGDDVSVLLPFASRYR